MIDKIDILGSENFMTIYEFCKAACHNDSDRYVWKNMGFLYWASNTASLLHRIYIARTVKFVTIVDNIHISGVEHLNENTAIIGKRHFLMKEYRMKAMPLTKEAIPAQVEWCKANGYHTILLTYNENHNKLAQIHRRWIAGKSIPGYEIGKSILKDFTEYPEKIEINGQLQYVFYYQFDKRRKLDFTRA